MIKKNAVLAEAYYKSMNDKDLPGTAKYLHPDVHFLTPFADIRGKEAVLGAIKGFLSYLKNLTVRSKFEFGDQLTLVYDGDYSEPIGTVRTAALMTFKDDLIIDVELFFDARSFEKK